MGTTQNELATAVAAPVPVPTPIHAPAPATIPVALTGWSPSTIAELEAVGVTEVFVDPRELVYRPVPVPAPCPCPCAPLHPPWRGPPCVWLHPPRPCPCARPPQRHGTPPSNANERPGGRQRWRGTPPPPPPKIVFFLGLILYLDHMNINLQYA